MKKLLIIGLISSLFLSSASALDIQKEQELRNHNTFSILEKLKKSNVKNAPINNIGHLMSFKVDNKLIKSEISLIKNKLFKNKMSSNDMKIINQKMMNILYSRSSQKLCENQSDSIVLLKSGYKYQFSYFWETKKSDLSTHYDKMGIIEISLKDCR